MCVKKCHFASTIPSELLQGPAPTHEILHNALRYKGAPLALRSACPTHTSWLCHGCILAILSWECNDDVCVACRFSVFTIEDRCFSTFDSDHLTLPSSISPFDNTTDAPPGVIEQVNNIVHPYSIFYTPKTNDSQWYSI